MEKPAGHRNSKTSHSLPQGLVEEAQEERANYIFFPFQMCAQHRNNVRSPPLKGVNEQMNKEVDRGRWRRNIWVPKPPPGYTVHKATAAVASGPVVEDPAPNLLTGSQARDCKGPRFNHRPPRHITSKGLRASGVSEEDQQDIITARKTKRRTSLAVQWLRLHASTAGGHGMDPWLENQDPTCHAAQPNT